MHITIVGQVDPAGINTGGIEVHICQLKRHLNAKGIGTLLLGWTYRHYHAEDFVSIARNKKLTGIRYLVYLIIKGPFIHIPKNSIIHGHRPDHVLPFFWRKNTIICTLHGPYIQNVKLKWGRFAALIYLIVQAIALKRADFVIYVSERTRQFFLSMHPFLTQKNHAVISPGVNEIFKPQDEIGKRNLCEIKNNKDEPVLIYVGRVEKEKNIAGLIEQVKGSRFKLLIVGDGREKAKLMRASKDHSNILFIDKVANERVPSLIHAADICVLFSEYEGMPTFVLEGLACGKPVLSTDVGDVRDLLKNGATGYIVTESDIMVHAEKLIMKDINQLSQKCVSASREHLWNRVVEKLIQVYSSLEK